MGTETRVVSVTRSGVVKVDGEPVGTVERAPDYGWRGTMNDGRIVCWHGHLKSTAAASIAMHAVGVGGEYRFKDQRGGPYTITADSFVMKGSCPTCGRLVPVLVSDVDGSSEYVCPVHGAV